MGSLRDGCEGNVARQGCCHSPVPCWLHWDRLRGEVGEPQPPPVPSPDIRSRLLKLSSQ